VRVENGDWLVPVVRGVGFENPREAEAYLLADNQLTLAAGWGDGLAEMLRELKDADALLGTGFTDADLAKLTPEVIDEVPPSALPADELRAKWGTARGQLWAAGAHRLLCDDATQEASYARLLGEARAAMLWTDPPYGVEYVGKTKASLTIENDGAEGLALLLAQFLKAAAGSLIAGAPFYITHPAGVQCLTFGQAIVQAGWRFHQTLIWIKSAMVLGHTDYHYRHEPMIYGYLPGPGRPGRGEHEGTHWYGGDSATSLFEIARPSRSERHPTMKPPALIARCIANSSRIGDIVLDAFAGSGSTLVAAEQLQRRGYAIELDPGYIAVMLERLASMGLKPILDA
jgi:DNA modification methylase